MMPQRLPQLPDAAWQQQFRRRLKRWYQRFARDLPWRTQVSPYHVWVSEVMLQQTQVATVVPYFQRFVEAFPSIEELANATEDQVLRHWEGLGYYRRARQLHRAAREIVAHHAGVFPRDPCQVDALPGIGRYTRGAILSIAFDQRQPILEANTIRLYSRLLRFAGDPRSREGQRLLWSFAETVLPRKHAGTINQAMMELGSVICTPRSPDCANCPVAPLCPTRAAGEQSSIPCPPPRQQYEHREESAVVVCKGKQVLLRRCARHERWAGLWDFPRFQHSADPRNNARQVEKLTGVRTATEREFAKFAHGVTRYRITLRCYRALYVSGRRHPGADLAWVRSQDLNGYPLSATGRKIARLVQQPPW